MSKKNQDLAFYFKFSGCEHMLVYRSIRSIFILWLINSFFAFVYPFCFCVSDCRFWTNRMKINLGKVLL